MVHKNSLANLVLFTGKDDPRNNRNGRPKSITTLIKEALNKKVICGHQIPNGMDAAEFLAESMIGHAIKGNAPYMNQVMDRMEGRVSVETETPDKIDAKPVIYIPDDGRDTTTEGTAGSVPVDEGGHSSNGRVCGGLENVQSPHEPSAPHQNGKGLRGGDISANGAGDHK